MLKSKGFEGSGNVGISDITLNSFIRTQCANLKRTNECIGIEEMCVIIKKKKECKYFKTCVLPIAKEKGYGAVISQYKRIDTNSGLKQIKVRNCCCGAEIPKGKKFCDKCRKERRKKTDRENHKKHSGSCHTVF